MILLIISDKGYWVLGLGVWGIRDSGASGLVV